MIIDKEQLYRDYKSKVFGYLYGKTSDVTVSEDLCSEVFLKILSHIDSFDEKKAKLSTWIYTITQNTFYDYCRTRHVSAELDENMEQTGDFVDDICNEEMLSRLADALEKLPQPERELILLHYYKKVSLKEIADKFGYSYSYIKVLHSRALDKLKDYLK